MLMSPFLFSPHSWTKSRKVLSHRDEGPVQKKGRVNHCQPLKVKSLRNELAALRHRIIKHILEYRFNWEWKFCIPGWHCTRTQPLRRQEWTPPKQKRQHLLTDFEIIYFQNHKKKWCPKAKGYELCTPLQTLSLVISVIVDSTIFWFVGSHHDCSYFCYFWYVLNSWWVQRHWELWKCY